MNERIKYDIERVAQSLESLCRSVAYNGIEIEIDSPDFKPVVLVSDAELSSLRETVHLLSSPINAIRLYESLAEMESGEVLECSIEDLKKRFYE